MSNIRHHATILLDELDAGWLEVCKIPSNGGYIRIPVSVNAEWYSQFCRQFLMGRRKYPKPRTIIKRCHTRHALRQIIAGKTDGVYIERLLSFIEE